MGIDQGRLRLLLDERGIGKQLMKFSRDRSRIRERGRPLRHGAHPNPRRLQFATVKINPARRFHIATTAERKD
jgi:hypothetical protein